MFLLLEKKINKKRTTGFSLVELMVSVNIFSVVMTVSIGALLSVIEANRKAQALTSVMNNLNFALENMSRNMRIGTNYHCSTSTAVPPNFDTTNDCSTGGVLIAFEAFNGNASISTNQIIYRFINTRIEKSSDGGATFIPITASEVTIEDMRFYVVGSSDTDTKQPRILITINGRAGISARAQTDFDLQTTISQRTLDL